MEDHDDFAFEVAPGLPEPLPKGEHILWQGRPEVWQLAVESLAIRWVAAWFVLLTIYRVGAALADYPLGIALTAAVAPAVTGVICIVLLVLFARAQARATVYTITTARVILRVGAALQVTLQLPFGQIANAALDLRKNGTGTIALEPKEDGGEQLGYLVLWPHVRPWHMRKPQPALRAIAHAKDVAETLAIAAEGAINRPTVEIAEPRPTAATADPVPAE